MSRKSQQGQRTDPDIQLEVEKLARDGWNAAQIHRKLSADPRFNKRLPVARTIQNLVRAITPRNSSGPWSLADSNPEDAALVLPVLAAVAEHTEGRRETMTLLEAEWTARLRRAAPDLPLHWVFQLAWIYVVRDEHKQSTAELDAMLGFAPWRGDEAFNRYLRFVYTAHPDWVPRAPEVWLTGTPESGGISPAVQRSRRAYALHVAVDMRRDLTGEDFEYPALVEGEGTVTELYMGRPRTAGNRGGHQSGQAG